MKRMIVISLLLALFTFIFSVYIGLANPVEHPDPPPVINEPFTETPTESPSHTDKISSDKNFTVTLLNGESSLTVTMEDFLIGAVSAEMPAGFEPEALMAQAVALRTYVLYKMNNPSSAHEENICSDSSCCAAWKSEAALREKWGEDYDEYINKIYSAVSSTDGYYLTYSGEPILAAFHSSSAGTTESSAAVWSSDLPYLVSVTSPETAEDVPNYNTTVTLLPTDFKNTVLSKYPSADFSAPPEKWISGAVYDSGGRLKSVTAGGVEIKGTALRSLFSLRSAAVDIYYSADENAVVMSVTGYGHGVGMSQFGANVMAEDGSAWEEILAWYYPGTFLENMKEAGQT